MRAWDPAWEEALQPRLACEVWRAVETQHVASTMQLVDTAAEQDVLERLLESSSKPPLPPEAQGLHFLVATPFRYTPQQGSRFRGPGRLGIWYGAEHVRTALAEVAYWRHRFLLDSPGLVRRGVTVGLTTFQCSLAGKALDLTQAPWSAAACHWMHPSNHAATQSLGAWVDDDTDIGWIRYASVRDPGGHCAAVFDPRALTFRDDVAMRTWACRVTANGAFMREERSGEHFDFPA